MGRKKSSVPQTTTDIESAATVDSSSGPSKLPFANITAATANNAQMAEIKGKKKARNKDKVDSIRISCGPGGDADEIHCVSKPVKTYQCSLPESENDLVTSLKKCVLSDQTKAKKKKKEVVDEELQNLLDFIEGKDLSKENAAPSTSKKPKKKKKKTQPVQAKESESKESQAKVEDQSSKEQQGKDSDCKKDKVKKENGKVSKTDRAKDSGASSDTSSSASSDKSVRPKKPAKKPSKPLSKEELEIMQLLQYIEGPGDKQAATSASAAAHNDKDNSDQNNNSSERKKKNRQKKEPKAFDFDTLKENTHLEQKMIDEILKTPACVNEYRLFNPKQVAHLFSTGHNEHWERFPECAGRLKALERSREGLTLCDPGSKQLGLVFAELRRERGKNITKGDFIEALKCRAYLHCAKCGYTSDIVALH